MTIRLNLAVNGATYAAPVPSINTTLRNELISRAGKSRADIDRFALEAALPGGRNLLSSQTLSLVLSEGGGLSQDTIQLVGNPITATSLGVSGTFTFDSDASINANLATLNTALNRVRDEESRLGLNQSYVKQRFDLNKADIDFLKTSGDEIVAADETEESARLSALNTRSSFGVQSFSLANQAQQTLLQLLR